MRRLILVTLLLLAASPAFAQYDRPPGSIFAAVHLGAGWGQASLEASGQPVAESGAQGGAFWGFRVGRALSEIAVLGVDYFAYSSVQDQPKDLDRVESEFWVIGPSMSWYPGTGGFYLKGLVGWGGVNFRLQDGDQTAVAEEKGLGLIGSIGYEIPINVRLSLGAQVDYVWMSVDEVQVADGVGGREAADFRFDTWGLNAFLMLNY